jgi:hypothetical protein
LRRDFVVPNGEEPNVAILTDLAPAGSPAPIAREPNPTLLLDSGVFTDQQLHERTQQRFASLADVVHKLEEPQVEREFLLGNAPMRAQPTPQERPEAFHCVYVHFAKAVPVFISGKLASPMVDTLMIVSLNMQASINAILVCINMCTWKDGVFDKGLDRLLLDIGQQIDDHLTTVVRKIIGAFSSPQIV